MIDIEVKHPALQFTKEEVVQILGQFNRTLDNVQVDVDTIKTWIESQPHLTHMPEDRLILSMLIMNKFSIEKTKVKMDYFYTMLVMIPELYKNHIPSNPEYRKIRKICHCFALPKLVNLNQVVFLVMDEMNHEFNGYTFLGKIYLNIGCIMYRGIYNGFELILDLSASNFSFWTAFTPTMAKIIISSMEKVLSNRMKRIRVIGLPTVAETFIFYMISLLPQKIKERVSFHKNLHEMAEIYPKEHLPLEYGGMESSYRELSGQFEDMVDKCEEFLQQLQDFKVDETLRPNKLDNDEILGFHGNFRKLDVD